MILLQAYLKSLEYYFGTCYLTSLYFLNQIKFFLSFI